VPAERYLRQAGAVMSFPAVEPPYVAVIFRSVQTSDSAGYGETADRMDDLAARQPGYLGVESVRDPSTGAGITVSYWRTEEAAAAWKRVAEHAEAQRAGRERWYRRYRVEVATVTRAYGFERDAG
jgi:heme-degrading monooxygenase HmoA